MSDFSGRLSNRGAANFSLLWGVPLMMFVVVLGIFMYYEGRKAYWDYQVREMCEKDGGLVVFERMQISQSAFLVMGGQVGVRGVPIPHESDSTQQTLVFRRTNDEIVRPRNPLVRRSTTEFVRRSDGKILGKLISYARQGGDFSSWAHDSSFLCPQPIIASEQIVQVEGESK